MSNKLCKNLDSLMLESRLSAEELARRVGLPSSTIKKIRTNRASNPTLSTLEPLAQYFSLSVSQLIGDEPIPMNRIPGTYVLKSTVLTTVPILTWQEAISWPATKAEDHAIINTENQYSIYTFALIVQEDNWENLMKGTALLVDPSLTIEHRDFAIIYKKGEKLPSVKQLLIDEGHIYLKPIINGYNITAITNEHKILGVVVEYKKQLKNNNYSRCYHESD